MTPSSTVIAIPIELLLAMLLLLRLATLAGSFALASWSILHATFALA